jgi:hypothetical protein
MTAYYFTTDMKRPDPNCRECDGDGWQYPSPHGYDPTYCPRFYDFCRCEADMCHCWDHIVDA